MKTKLLKAVILAALFNVSACGYFLYPERVGQTEGKLDTAVILLDAAGLLIGVLPGVVAFAVDVSTGAIYLSPGEKSTIEKHSNRNSSKNPPAKVVDRNKLSINTTDTATKLSGLIGKPVKADQIEFYYPNEDYVAVSL